MGVYSTMGGMGRYQRFLECYNEFRNRFSVEWSINFWQYENNMLPEKFENLVSICVVQIDLSILKNVRLFSKVVSLEIFGCLILNARLL